MDKKKRKRNNSKLVLVSDTMRYLRPAELPQVQGGGFSVVVQDSCDMGGSCSGR